MRAKMAVARPLIARSGDGCARGEPHLRVLRSRVRRRGWLCHDRRRQDHNRTGDGGTGRRYRLQQARHRGGVSHTRSAARLVSFVLSERSTMTMLEVPLQIFRYKAGESPHYDTFTVQVADTAHVIDAIDAVWATHDRSLTFRRACHHSSCGSCALRINGVEKLPCITRVTDVWDGHTPLRLDPLRNFPIVSDLVVDVSGFFQRMSASEYDDHARRRAVPAAQRRQARSAECSPSRSNCRTTCRSFNRFENCIECGICMSACPTMAADDKFLGPAGLAAIYRARQKTDDPQRSGALAGAGGWRTRRVALPQRLRMPGSLSASR